MYILLDQSVNLFDNEEYYDNVNVHHKLVGSLTYLTITKLDLRYIVGILIQFKKKPCKIYLDAIRRIMRYVKLIVNF